MFESVHFHRIQPDPFFMAATPVCSFLLLASYLVCSALGCSDETNDQRLPGEEDEHVAQHNQDEQEGQLIDEASEVGHENDELIDDGSEAGHEDEQESVLTYELIEEDEQVGEFAEAEMIEAGYEEDEPVAIEVNEDEQFELPDYVQGLAEAVLLD